MLVLYNARVYTQDSTRSDTERPGSGTAIAISQGSILAVGEMQQLLREFEERAELIDLGGRVVMPGLTDAHIHLENYALGLQKVDCETSTRAECLERVAERALSSPPGAWILGHGWNQNDWPEGFGTAADLDAVAPLNPVYLSAKSLHAAWVNSSALNLAKIDENTQDTVDSRLGRQEDGKPDGILFEAAMNLVSQVIPEPTVDEVAQSIRVAQPVLWGMGLTGVHDFDRRRSFAALQSLRKSDELRLRVVKSIPLDDLPHAAALGLRGGYGDDFLRIGQVKMFTDGALGPHTAAMLQPYEMEPDNRGMLFMDAEELFEHGRLAVDNGLGLAIHAIGDRANHEVLKALTQLRAYEQERLSHTAPEGQSGLRRSKLRHSNLRHRIEHVQVIHSQDAGRLTELGVVASMQPIHATSDMYMADDYWGERAALAYGWQTQLQHGAVLAFGSDAPVESPNPFWGLHAAVTRRRVDGSPGPKGWYPEQRLNAADALRAYTTGPAYAADMEGRLGKLAPGYLADLLVLETDPFTCEPEELRTIRPWATMVAGEWVYREAS